MTAASTETPARDLAAFRAAYNLPTQSDYLAMLSSPDHAAIAASLTSREQNAVIRLREEGFNGSTLAEAYEWWHAGGLDAAPDAGEHAASCAGHSAGGCGGACCC